MPLLPDIHTLVHKVPSARGQQGGSLARWGDGREHTADRVRDAAVPLGHVSCPCHEAPGPSLEVLDQTALERIVQKAEQDLTAQAAADTHAVSCRSGGLH